MNPVLVIGAGSSGLAAVKALLEEGLNPVCVELTNNIGGLWNYTDEPCPERATVFKGVVTNSSREILAYSDFPQPLEHPTYVPHHLIVRYFNLYAQHFNLKKFIRFEHKVIQVKPTPDHNLTGEWVVRIKDLKQDREYEEVFGVVLVCSGHHAFPKIPDFPGRNVFKGKQIHSHDYRKPDQFANENVIVIGFGNSGCDIAAECSFWAEKVLLSSRKPGFWITPRFIGGVTPVDCAWIRRSLATLGKIWPSRVISKLENDVNQPYNHEYLGLKKSNTYRIVNQYPAINDFLPMQLANGKVKMVQGVVRLTEHGVILENGQELNGIDTIIYATGFLRKFPFLDGIVNAQKDIDTFYKFVFPANLSKNTLAFIGLMDPDAAFVMASEIQSRWIARVITGKFKLPAKDFMIEDTKKAVQNNVALFTEKFRIDNYVVTTDYVDLIASFVGCKPNLFWMMLTDYKLFWACFTGPLLNHQYRLRGPHSWSKARETILDFERVRYGSHLKTGQVDQDAKASNKTRIVLAVSLGLIGSFYYRNEIVEFVENKLAKFNS